MKTILSATFDKPALKDIARTVLVPAASGFAFLAWCYFLVDAAPPRTLVFPLIGLILTGLYFFSGPVHGGVLMGFVSVAGFFCAFFSDTAADKAVFGFETVWLWSLFLLFESYRRRYKACRDQNAEEEEKLETGLTLVKSTIEERLQRYQNLHQQFANYQSLERIAQELSSKLDEESIVGSIEKLANDFIGKGRWKVKRGAHSDLFAQYVRDYHLPLIVQNLSSDSRFFARHARFSSLIAVPLEAEEKFWGILRGTSPQPGTFDESDLRFVSVLGGLASLALNNARLYQKKQALAITDALTGLYVQSFFKERLEEELLRSGSHGIPLSIALLDLDHFKQINDTYGHAAGDVVLRQVAMLLRRRLRETDLISRYGGEEFGVIMPQTERQEALRVAEDIRKGTEEEKFFLPVESFRPVQVQVTVSIGLASRGGAGIDGDIFLRCADDALYQAKKKGRNRVEMEINASDLT